MVCKLEEFPREVILIILSNVSSKDLWRNVRLTCRVFHSLITNSYLWINRIQRLGLELCPSQDEERNFRLVHCCIQLEEQREHWTAERLKQYTAVTGHHATVDAIKFINTPSSRRLCISGSRDRSLVLWDVDKIAGKADENSWKVASAGSAHQGWIWSVSTATPDVLYSGGWDHYVKRWQITEDELKETHATVCSGAVLSVLCDKNEIFYSTYDKKIGVMDARQGMTSVGGSEFHRQPVLDLAHAAGSPYLYSCGEDSRILCIDCRTWNVVKTLILPCYSQTLSLLNNNLLCGTSDGRMLLLDTKDFSSLSEVNSSSRQVIQVQLTPASQICITKGRDFRMYTTGLRPTLFAELTEFDTELARFDFRNGDLAVTCGDGSIMFWLREL